MNNELVIKLEQIAELESKLIMIKIVEKQIKDAKEELRQQMILHKNMLENEKTLFLPNGTKATLVEDTPESEIEVEVLNTDAWGEKNTNLVAEKQDLMKRIEESQKDYTTIEKQIKNGRKGYVRITLPKEVK